MQEYKLQKNIKKKMEQELFQYYENIVLLQKLKEQNTSSTRRYLYIEQKISYVKNVYNRLNSFERKVFEAIFKEKYTLNSIQREEYISKNTYYRVLNKSTYFLAEEWGEV